MFFFMHESQSLGRMMEKGDETNVYLDRNIRETNFIQAFIEQH